MTEGEFKKLIVEAMALSLVADDPNILKAVSMIIEDAKKEFPVFGHIQQEFQKKRQIGPVDDLRQEYVHAIYNWFEKWFGK